MIKKSELGNGNTPIADMFGSTTGINVSNPLKQKNQSALELNNSFQKNISSLNGC